MKEKNVEKLAEEFKDFVIDEYFYHKKDFASPYVFFSACLEIFFDAPAKREQFQFRISEIEAEMGKLIDKNCLMPKDLLRLNTLRDDLSANQKELKKWDRL